VSREKSHFRPHNRTPHKNEEREKLAYWKIHPGGGARWGFSLTVGGVRGLYNEQKIVHQVRPQVGQRADLQGLAFSCASRDAIAAPGPLKNKL